MRLNNFHNVKVKILCVINRGIIVLDKSCEFQLKLLLLDKKLFELEKRNFKQSNL